MCANLTNYYILINPEKKTEQQLQWLGFITQQIHINPYINPPP